MARTVVIPPIQTAGLNNMYAIQEDGDIDSPVSPSRTRRRSSHNRVPGTPPLSALNSPRRLSNSSNSSALSRESARSELQRASSWGSKTSFESFESGHWKPVDFGPRSPGAAPTGQSQGQHDEDASLLDRLPDAVLGCVLDQLKDLHLNQKAGGTCATCWMRDVCSVSLASRKWSKAARVAL